MWEVNHSEYKKLERLFFVLWNLDFETKARQSEQIPNLIRSPSQIFVLQNPFPFNIEYFPTYY